MNSRLKYRGRRRESKIGNYALPILVLLGIGIAALKIRRDRREMAGKVDVRPISKKDYAISKPKPLQTRLAVGKGEGQSESTATAGERNADIGLKSAGYVVDSSGERSVRVIIKPYPVCHKGDLEAIAKVVGENGSVLVSLEQIGGVSAGHSGPGHSVVPIRDIETGVTVDLKVGSREAGVYGIFICSDATKADSCNGKESADFEAILGGIDDVPAEFDQVFYFQIAALKSEYAMVYGGNNRMLPQAKSALLDDRELSDKQVETVWPDAVKYSKRVQSLPSETAPSGQVTAFVIPLAKFDERACNHSN
jgi:hypothetical protein